MKRFLFIFSVLPLSALLLSGCSFFSDGDSDFQPVTPSEDLSVPFVPVDAEGEVQDAEKNLVEGEEDMSPEGEFDDDEEATDADEIADSNAPDTEDPTGNDTDIDTTAPDTEDPDTENNQPTDPDGGSSSEDATAYEVPENWSTIFIKDPQGSQYDVALHPAWYWNATGDLGVAAFATYALPLEDGETTHEGDMLVHFSNRKATDDDGDYEGTDCDKKETLNARNALWNLCFHDTGDDEPNIQAFGVVGERYFSPTLSVVGDDASDIEKAEKIFKTMISSIRFK